MSNLKELRKRIKSVKSTQKITKAMKVVSAAKLRKVRMKAEASQPYARLMRGVMRHLAANGDAASLPALIAGNGAKEKTLILAISSDRGLCGSYNSHVTKKLRDEITAIKERGGDFQVYFVGRKLFSHFSHLSDNQIAGKEFGLSSKRDVPFALADALATSLIASFEKGEFSRCRVIYTEFVNALVQRVSVRPLIPVESEGDETQANVNSGELHPVYEYEPDQEEILKEILPKNVAVQLYDAILESAASEHAARMTAMDNANRNAGKMVGELTLRYNRSRQAAITKELIEIISGAEAV
ncbi:MAG: F0F1 ATP synthase subunit gamma [Rickettsiales bacterium]